MEPYTPGNASSDVGSNARKLRDSAVILPVTGTLFFLPPFLLIFDHPWTLFGIPFLHLSIFTIWLVGIALTAYMSTRLSQRQPTLVALPQDERAPSSVPTPLSSAVGLAASQSETVVAPRPVLQTHSDPSLGE